MIHAVTRTVQSRAALLGRSAVLFTTTLVNRDTGEPIDRDTVAREFAALNIIGVHVMLKGAWLGSPECKHWPQFATIERITDTHVIFRTGPTVDSSTGRSYELTRELFQERYEID